MDLGLSRDMFDAFLRYQALMEDQFKLLQKVFGFTIVDGNQSASEVNIELRRKIRTVLATG